MTNPSEAISHSIGKHIAGARTADDFRLVLDAMMEITPDYAQEHLAPDYDRLYARLDTKQGASMLGVLRTHAIGLGCAVLLLAPEEESETDPSAAELIKSYMNGIKEGHFSRWEARAEIGEQISKTIRSKLMGASYSSFHAALGLRELGRGSKLFTARQKLEVSFAFASHRYRHRATRAVIRMARQAEAKGTAET